MLQCRAWALHEAWGHAVPWSYLTSLVRAALQPSYRGLSGFLCSQHTATAGVHNTPHLCWYLGVEVAVQCLPTPPEPLKAELSMTAALSTPVPQRHHGQCCLSMGGDCVGL